MTRPADVPPRFVMTYSRILSFVFLALTLPLRAQFKEVGPAPYSQAVARQKIRTLLDKTDPRNPQPAIDALFALVPWYRDILDQELIAGWQKDSRATIQPLMGQLADAAVAKAIVEYSWRQAPQATFNLTNAAMLGQLMARYPDSAQPFRDDLLGKTPALPDPVAEAVCRILMDMPDLGTWKKDALQILPHYRPVVDRLIAEDMRGDDREKNWRAQMWRRELNGDEPGTAGRQSVPRRPAVSQPATTLADRTPPPSSSNGRPTLRRVDPQPAPQSVPASPPQLAPAPAPVPAPAAPPSLYAGAKSGTLQCGGGSVPQNAEYVFKNLPRGNLQLDYDSKVWDARLAPGEGQTQKLILRNISSGPQKRCTVHWSVTP